MNDPPQSVVIFLLFHLPLFNPSKSWDFYLGQPKNLQAYRNVFHSILPFFSNPPPPLLSRLSSFFSLPPFSVDRRAIRYGGCLWLLSFEKEKCKPVRFEVSADPHVADPPSRSCTALPAGGPSVCAPPQLEIVPQHFSLRGALSSCGRP